METEEGFEPVFFDPRPLTNLYPIDTIESMCPILDMQAHNLTEEDMPHCTRSAVCGMSRITCCRFKHLRQGIADRASWR